MVYIPREIIKLVLKARRQLMFKDRIHRMESKIHLPFELDLLEARSSLEIWKSTVRVGFYEISRMVLYCAPFHSDSPVNDFSFATFYMYKWLSPGCRINVGYQSVALSWDDDGYAVGERMVTSNIAPTQLEVDDDVDVDYIINILE